MTFKGTVCLSYKKYIVSFNEYYFLYDRRRGNLLPVDHHLLPTGERMTCSRIYHEHQNSCFFLDTQSRPD